MIEELESLRKKGLTNIIIKLFIAGILLIIIYYINNFKTNFDSLIGDRITVISLIIILILGYQIFKKYKDLEYIYKEKLYKLILEKYIKNIQINFKQGFDKETVKNSKLLLMQDYFKSNDFIKGKYKNVNIAFSDIKIIENISHLLREDSEKTVFKGQFFIIDFNKQFQAKTYLIDKSMKNANREINGTHIKLEDDEFNKIFDIITENEHDAYYILTPQIMSKIKTLKSNIKGDLSIGFIDNKLYIALNNNKDLFKIKIHKKIDLNDIEQLVLGDLKDLFNLIDILNLENDLFKMEVGS